MFKFKKLNPHNATGSRRCLPGLTPPVWADYVEHSCSLGDTGKEEQVLGTSISCLLLWLVFNDKDSQCPAMFWLLQFKTEPFSGVKTPKPGGYFMASTLHPSLKLESGAWREPQLHRGALPFPSPESKASRRKHIHQKIWPPQNKPVHCQAQGSALCCHLPLICCTVSEMEYFCHDSLCVSNRKCVIEKNDTIRELCLVDKMIIFNIQQTLDLPTATP